MSAPYRAHCRCGLCPRCNRQSGRHDYRARWRILSYSADRRDGDHFLQLFECPDIGPVVDFVWCQRMRMPTRHEHNRRPDKLTKLKRRFAIWRHERFRPYIAQVLKTVEAGPSDDPQRAHQCRSGLYLIRVGWSMSRPSRRLRSLRSPRSCPQTIHTGYPLQTPGCASQCDPETSDRAR